jgi:predicted metal-binding transcription factor (methanogenesis marker protein 9)
MNSEELLIGNICMGGSAVALAYCCSASKDCPLRDRVLSEIGIPKEKFTEIKEKHRVEADVCFGNLAYCCSLEKECEKRDRALEKLGMSREEYIKYKLAIAEEFYSLVGERLFSVKPLRTYVANALDLDSGKEYRIVMLGDGEVLRVLTSEEVGCVDIGKGRIACVYLRGEELRRLAEISRENGQSISKTAREAVLSYLSAREVVSSLLNPCVEATAHTLERTDGKKLK